MTASTEGLVALDGALNFRDLGGYPAAEGRSTRWGCVFRSDGLDQLTDRDLDRSPSPRPGGWSSNAGRPEHHQTMSTTSVTR
jgi:hypothetical protein